MLIIYDKPNRLKSFMGLFLDLSFKERFFYRGFDRPINLKKDKSFSIFLKTSL